jgi:hypothetical protein
MQGESGEQHISPPTHVPQQHPEPHWECGAVHLGTRAGAVQFFAQMPPPQQTWPTGQSCDVSQHPGRLGLPTQCIVESAIPTHSSSEQRDHPRQSSSSEHSLVPVGAWQHDECTHESTVAASLSEQSPAPAHEEGGCVVATHVPG